MRGDKKLTAEEFEALLPHLQGMKECNVKALEKIMVHGALQKELVADLGVTKEMVSAMVVKAWQLHIEHGIRPEGFVRITATLPKELAEAVKDIERRAHEKARGGKL